MASTFVLKQAGAWMKAANDQKQATGGTFNQALSWMIQQVRFEMRDYVNWSFQQLADEYEAVPEDAWKAEALTEIRLRVNGMLVIP